MNRFLFAAWFGICLFVGFTIMGLINPSSALLTGTVSSLLFTLFTLDLANRIHHAESDKNEVKLGTNIRLTNWGIRR